MKKLAIIGTVALFTTQAHAYTPRFDKEFDSTKAALIKNDLQELNQYRFDLDASSWFAKIFQGTDGTAISKYLEPRVQYLAPASVNFTDRVSGAPYFAPPYEMRDSNGNIIAYLSAYNIGFDLWMIQMKYWEDSKVTFSTGLFSSIPVKSPRIGIVAIGEGFYKYMPSRAERIATLIHEGRHSDCTGGLSYADHNRLQRNLPLENKACGHEHSICPAGHKYAGTPNCEAHAWGAYAVETVFLDAVANHCGNCTEEDKAGARKALTDRTSKVVNWDALSSGQLGDPIMTSGGAPWEN